MSEERDNHFGFSIGDDGEPKGWGKAASFAKKYIYDPVKDIVGITLWVMSIAVIGAMLGWWPITSLNHFAALAGGTAAVSGVVYGCVKGGLYIKNLNKPSLVRGLGVGFGDGPAAPAWKEIGKGVGLTIGLRGTQTPAILYFYVLLALELYTVEPGTDASEANEKIQKMMMWGPIITEFVNLLHGYAHNGPDHNFYARFKDYRTNRARERRPLVDQQAGGADAAAPADDSEDAGARLASCMTALTRCCARGDGHGRDAAPPPPRVNHGDGGGFV